MGLREHTRARFSCILPAAQHPPRHGSLALGEASLAAWSCNSPYSLTRGVVVHRSVISASSRADKISFGAAKKEMMCLTHCSLGTSVPASSSLQGS